MGKSIYYEIEFIDSVVKKINYKGKQGSLYLFKYDDLNKAKKLIDTNNGIYFVTRDSESTEIYVGQTTNGLFRFTEHKMRQYQDTAEIIFFQFDGESPNKNVLDYLEVKMINYLKDSKYKILNLTKGNKSSIRGIDEQFANEVEPTIIILLKLAGIDLFPHDDTTKEIKINLEGHKKYKVVKDHKDDFYLKSKGANFTISREGDMWILRKGSKVNGKKRLLEDPESVGEIYFYKTFAEMVDDKGVVTEDISWKSISPLVAFARGQVAAPGWTEIKNSEGKTPHEVYRLQDGEE